MGDVFGGAPALKGPLHYVCTRHLEDICRKDVGLSLRLSSSDDYCPCSCAPSAIALTLALARLLFPPCLPF